MTIAAAQRTAGPTLLAFSAADAESHQRSAVIEIDADPVPTDGLTVQVFAGPFVIEPSLACDTIRAALTRDGARHAEMRQAVVVARGLGRGALAADTGVDRKSTRLNSSHQIISYAVFCL